MHQNYSSIVLATNNIGKVKEFENGVNNISCQLVPQSNYNVPEIEETGLTFIENALLKARNASKHSGLPAIGDDSGLIIDALNGRPGLYSARFAGKKASQEEHIAKVLKELGDTPFEKRTARFYCILVFLKSFDDPTPKIAEGIWEGKILSESKGAHGFGYDPIFYVPTHDCSAAEITAEEKFKISHRGTAWQKIVTLI